MPGFTHLKNAQPLSLAHYLLAYFEMFKRDKKKFKKNILTIDYLATSLMKKILTF